MDLNLEKARVGLRLAVQHINSFVTCSENNFDNVSPVISAAEGPEHNEDYCPIRSESQDFSVSFRGRVTDASKHVNNRSPGKKTGVKETTMKRPRLDNSKSKYKQHDSITNSKEKVKNNEIGNKSADVLSPPYDNGQPQTYATLFRSVIDSGFAETCTDQEAVKVTTKKTKLGSSENAEKNTGQHQNNESYDGEIESFESNCSTYFSAFEDDGCDDTTSKLQLENVPTEEKSYGQLLIESPSINLSTHKSSTLYLIRLFFDVLEEEAQTLKPTNTLICSESKVKEVVDAFVQLSDSNSAEAVQKCKTEAVKSLQKVYERFFKFSQSRAPFEDPQWSLCSKGFSILQTLCDSKSICEEFIKFFTSHMMTPESTTDPEDPKKIIEGLAEYDTARFGLIQLHNALRKYSKFVKKSDCQSNICSANSQQVSLNTRKRIESKKDKLDIELLRKFNEYEATQSDKFLALNYITTRNVTLLKCRKYSES